MLISLLDLRNYLKSFLATDSQFKMNKIFHCLNFNSLLLKHELQTFHLWYTCILQLISSLITSIHATVFSSYTDDVFNWKLILSSRYLRVKIQWRNEILKINNCCHCISHLADTHFACKMCNSSVLCYL